MNRESILFALLFVSSLALADRAPALPEPDTTFEDRSDRVLTEIAGRFDGLPSGDSCFDFGAATISLVAQLELGERGAQGGVTPGEASDTIAAFADRAIEWTGECHDRCNWGEAGSPGTMHALMGLGMILHRYENELPANVVEKIETAADGWWRPHSWRECPTDGEDDGNESAIGPWLVNGNLSIVAGHLLAGERIGYGSEVWQDGLDELESIYETAVHHGGLEMNAPIYTPYQFAALAPMLELEHDEARRKARILLDYLFLVQAHLYLPSGGLGAPQARDYGGGAHDAYPSSLHDVIWFYTGDEPFDPDANVHGIGAAVDYQLPPVIRSIFLDKAEGYDFNIRTPAPAASRHGRGYDVGEEYPVAPWRGVVTPDAMFGVNHGFRYQAIHVGMGVYARTAPETFPILYQYEPYVDGDTVQPGSSFGLPSGSGDTDPDDFTRELFDYRRMIHERSMISIWDPREESKESGIVRQAEDTRVQIPDYEDFGGEFRRENTAGWYVGRADETYIAYRPLGTVEAGPETRTSSRGAGGGAAEDTDYVYLRLDGRSGGIVELATTDQFPTIDDYVDNLKERHVDFVKGDPMYAEFDALETGSTETTRIRLEYEPERHVVDGSEQPLPDSIDDGLVDSPFVNYDSDAQTLTVTRACYDRLVYDLADATVDVKRPSDEECVGEPLDTTVFSDVPQYGDFANYEPEHPDRWQVVEQSGDRRLFLTPFEYEKEEDRLGEVATVYDRTFDEVRIELRAKTHEDLESNDAADYAVVFGYQDHDNYYFMLANSHEDYSELFVLEDGVRRQLARASKRLVPDAEWHQLEIVREGSEIEVKMDGEQVLSARDDTYGEGRVGVGALNDSVLFDDIAAGGPGEGEMEPDTGFEQGADAAADVGGDRDGDGVPADAPADSQTRASHGGGEDDSDGCGCGVGEGRAPGSLLLVALLGAWRLRRRS